MAYLGLSPLGQDAITAKEELVPAVTVRSSVKHGHLVCLEDGKKFKTLKRHLMTEHGMTPAEYRERWGLSADYPLVAAEYADKRSALPQELGLGRKPAKKAGKASSLQQLNDDKKPWSGRYSSGRGASSSHSLKR